MCSPRQRSTFGFFRMPSWMQRAAPPEASSAGWKTKRMLPASDSRASDASCASPSAMAACVSCPQACITPSFSEAKGRSVFSGTGKASMSARQSTHGPLRAPFTSAVAPVFAMGRTSSRSSCDSRSRMTRCVRSSFQESSGCRCRSRRTAITSSVMRSTSSRTLGSWARRFTAASLPPRPSPPRSARTSRGTAPPTPLPSTAAR